MDASNSDLLEGDVVSPSNQAAFNHDQVDLSVESEPASTTEDETPILTAVARDDDLLGPGQNITNFFDYPESVAPENSSCSKINFSELSVC